MHCKSKLVVASFWAYIHLHCYGNHAGHQPALKQSSHTGSRQASTTGSDKRSKWTLAMAINLALFKSLCSMVTDKQVRLPANSSSIAGHDNSFALGLHGTAYHLFMTCD